MRGEEMERIRRRGVRERNDAVGAGGRHSFDPNSPWKWVWEQAALSQEFWKEELETPADQFRFGSIPLGEHLGADSLVSRPGSAASSSGGQREKRGLQAGADDPPPPAIPPKKPKVHSVQGGLYVSNRSGNKLCDAFKMNGICD